MVLEEEPDVGHSVPEHGDPFDSHAERERISQACNVNVSAVVRFSKSLGICFHRSVEFMSAVTLGKINRFEPARKLS